ncbi:MAG: small subunit ribosomal protein [Candidatus Dependentiae bacterium]|nr:small subunit ribosomal protein [Candidatus Dependentiae bacterium]
MANIKSSKKDIVKSEIARQRNVACRTAVKTARRKVLDAIAAKDFAAAKTLLQAAESLIARAGKKGVLKKQTASRKVSRLTKTLSEAVGAGK